MIQYDLTDDESRRREEIYCESFGPIRFVGHEEFREVEQIKDKDGNVVELKPVPGSERSFVKLQLPGGHVVRAEVPHAEFDEHIVPLIDRASTELARSLGLVSFDGSSA